ncbi:MAG: hypothetical protein AUJ92_19880 [Armatimonadetes bacterium CG2_30_59_28]|nr:hypothetical protein [Armatimonadota bacterium]OIO90072.1 MAG: hypothetical protein AUJ92_19880 [Armatimonadetes bacterium CG2_30_59_28]PIU60535.1 MAG: hypothetical protein COS85_24180 [Armatimonadetes bacterium CG07_land_8_20_14_0_80_59_28]
MILVHSILPANPSQDCSEEKSETKVAALQISRREKRWLVAFSVGIMLLTMLPYLCAWGITPPGMRYQWLLYNPDEPNVHLAWMRQAADGHAAFVDLFTTEPQPRMFVHLLFLALGLLSRVLHLPLVTTYHAFRILAGILLLHSVYWLAAYFFRSVSLRRTAVWVTAVSSGLGWLAFTLNVAFTLNDGGSANPDLWGLRPVDVSRGLMMPEGFTFPSLLLYPLFTFSMFLMVCCFLYLLWGMEGSSRKALIAAGLCGLILGNIHTYNLLVVYAVLFFYLLTGPNLKRASVLRPCGKVALFIAISCPGLIYQYINFRTNPIFQEKALTLTHPQPPLDMAVSYGAVLALAVLGSAMLLERKREEVFLVVWLFVGSAIIYAPVSFSRKLIEGLHIPMSILAAYAIVRLINGLLLKRRTVRSAGGGQQRRLRGVLIGVVVLGMSLSNVQFLKLVMEWVPENNASRLGALMPPYYLSEDDVAATEWLESHASEDAIVLCLPYLGSYLPSLTGKRVFIGHWAETLRFAEKLSWIRDFLGGGTPAGGMDALGESGQSVYFVYGLYERLVTPAWVPPPGWREVFQRGSATVYQYTGT